MKAKFLDLTFRICHKSLDEGGKFPSLPMGHL